MVSACGSEEFSSGAGAGAAGAGGGVGGSGGQHTGGTAGKAGEAGKAGQAGKAGAGGAQGGQAGASGQGGSAGAGCLPGTADCDGNTANGCEADLTSTAEQCGTCGHSCLGGACVAGACQPLELAVDAHDPLGIAVLGDSVFWVDSAPGALRRIGKDGSGAFTYAQPLNRPNGIAADKDAGKIYVADYNANTVVACAAAGTTCVSMGTVSNPAFVTFDLAYVFVTAWGDGTVRRISKANNAMDVLAETQGHPQGIAMGANAVFWADGAAKIRKKAADNSGVVMDINNADISKPTGLRTEGTEVFYTALGDGAIGGSVGSCSKAGGSCASIASNQDYPWDLTVDLTHVYWTNYGGGQVMRVRRSNPGLATLLWSEPASKPWGIDVDLTAIYWSCQGTGKIMRLAK